MARRLFEEWFIRFCFPEHEGQALVETPEGLLPKGWERKPFGDVASFVNGYAFKPADWGDKGLPIIKIKELKGGITSQTPRYSKTLEEKYRLSAGDILLNSRAD